MSEPDLSAEPILDAGVIARLHALEEGDDRLVAELVAEFLARTPERFARMRTLLGAGNVPELEREAHSFNGSCGALGITRMRLRALALEHHLHTQGLGGAEALMGQLEAAFQEALPLLSAEL
ncbi:Hpt domain-containing protein [Aggregicoccus sp. 17bor-14]|uniref:Hpt domain-containing protein n=1 Tax=Myxococcaceae TaxID=31 RepID=UPI00129C1984|nr:MULTISPECIES: Hpt domain-containing protein [Myxococcaceae]MBF5045208.1 Hpt domain-containing protein [Simulacricoccus sp. 17bor-14]MRI90949.1 Hpt domain-containing protein [Aggregicoccus sp. 17bor-14]